MPNADGALQSRIQEIAREHLIDNVAHTLREAERTAPHPYDAYPWLHNHTEDEWAAIRAYTAAMRDSDGNRWDD